MHISIESRSNLGEALKPNTHVDKLCTDCSVGR